jgi:hypothetical protein
LYSTAAGELCGSIAGAKIYFSPDDRFVIGNKPNRERGGFKDDHSRPTERRWSPLQPLKMPNNNNKVKNPDIGK